MIYSIIFFAGLVLIAVHMIWVARKRSSRQMSTSWHRITPHKIRTYIVAPLSQKTHDILKKIVYTTLRWYQMSVKFLRKKVRTMIARVLHTINNTS